MMVDRVSPALGAEVSGIELVHLDDDGVDALYSALIEHQVLFFRDQHLAPIDHAAFGRRFGELGLDGADRHDAERSHLRARLLGA